MVQQNNRGQKRNRIFDCIPVQWFHKRSFWQLMFGNSSSQAHSISAHPPSAIATSNDELDFYLKQLPWKIACGDCVNDLLCHHGDLDSIAVPLFSNPNYSETSKLVYGDFSASRHLYEGIIHYRVGNMKAHTKSCTAAHHPNAIATWCSDSPSLATAQIAEQPKLMLSWNLQSFQCNHICANLRCPAMWYKATGKKIRAFHSYSLWHDTKLTVRV